MMRAVAILFALLAASVLAGAYGHEASEPNAQWFNSLEQPNTHINCCGSDHDCRAYDDEDVELHDGVYYVRYKSMWLSVPMEKMVDRYDNPTGHFVACVHEMGGGPIVLCAVRGMGT